MYVHIRMIKKYCLDLRVTSVERLHERYVLLRLSHDKLLPEMLPGQFVEISVPNSPTTFLRRPISINYVDRGNNELWLLVAVVGEGTRRLSSLKPGDMLNCVLPLGNGFSFPMSETSQCVLLVGGGIREQFFGNMVLSRRSSWGLERQTTC